MSEIRIYPVKSLAGVVVDAVEVEPWGLRHDRRWVVLDPAGDVITAREEHELLSLTALPESDGSLVLQATDGAVLRVVPPTDFVPLQTSLSRVNHVHAAGSEADEWLSARLKRSVRLGWLDDPRRRTVSSTHGGQPGDSLSLADAGPLLLVTKRSLEQLNAWIVQGAAERRAPAPAPIDALRFRPNVVVDGPDEPFSEDRWQTVRIGGVQFRFTEHCDRCVLTTIDPVTRHAGKEPLRTLARHRQWDHMTWFGIRLVPETHGRIETGDLVTIG